jgi:hypothetical protein
MPDLKSNLAVVKDIVVQVESVIAERGALKASAGTPTTPTVPGNGGTVITPDGFTDRWTPGDQWNATPLFEDNFPIVIPEGGAFPTRYSRWGAYPNYFPVTNKRGFYEPNLLSVKDLADGQTALTPTCSR